MQGSVKITYCESIETEAKLFVIRKNMEHLQNHLAATEEYMGSEEESFDLAHNVIAYLAGNFFRAGFRSIDFCPHIQPVSARAVYHALWPYVQKPKDLSCTRSS